MTRRQPKPPRWPTDEEIDSAPCINGDVSFWVGLMLASGSVEPEGFGGTTQELADYIEAGEAVAPLTPHMRQWLAHLLRQMPDRRRRGREEGARSIPVADTETERKIARRVAVEQKRWCERHDRQRVPSVETRAMIVRAIKTGPTFPADWLLDEARIHNIERHLKNKARLQRR